MKPWGGLSGCGTIAEVVVEWLYDYWEGETAVKRCMQFILDCNSREVTLVNIRI